MLTTCNKSITHTGCTSALVLHELVSVQEIVYQTLSHSCCSISYFISRAEVVAPEYKVENYQSLARLYKRMKANTSVQIAYFGVRFSIYQNPFQIEMKPNT